jgi:protease-4
MAKLGVEVRTIRSDQARPYKAAVNPFEQPSQEAIDELQALLNSVHEIFVDVVRQGRPALSQEQLDAVTNGQVWLGAKAIDKNLVDELGYLGKAIDGAIDLAGLTNAKVQRYSQRISLASLLGGRQASVNIDLESLHKAQSPQMLLLWKPVD